MESKRLLKLLCLLSFLLLIAPFYDHCNGQRMKQVEVPPEELAVEEVIPVIGSDTISTNNITDEVVENPTDTLSFEKPYFIKAYHWIDDGDSENAFEIAEIEIAFFIDFKIKKLGKDIAELSASDFIKGLAFHFKNFCFILIVANTLLILIFSAFKKVKKIYKHTLINLLFLILAWFAIVFFDPFFIDIRQIKWGYYVFIFLQIVIAVVARKSFIQKLQ